jgi:uncharacterized membrane protein
MVDLWIIFIYPQNYFHPKGVDMMAIKHTKEAPKGEVKNTKLCAILAYLLIGIIWYFVDKDIQKDEFVKFHVKQGVVLLIADIAFWIAISILWSILFFIPMLWMLLRLINLIPLLFTLIGIFYAVTDKKEELPIIGKYAEKLGI